MKTLIVGNWKMNGSLGLLDQYRRSASGFDSCAVETVICPPAPFLAYAKRSSDSQFKFGAQDCSPTAKGARTGEVSAEILASFGVQYCIVGHSERRQFMCETDQDIAAKLDQAIQSGITPILCVGETQAERDTGTWQEVIAQQLSVLDGLVGIKPIVAYEPVWSIGTGRVPDSADIDEVTEFISKRLRLLGFNRGKQRILYGGSATEQNAARLLSLHLVDGLLMGGVSLDAARFFKVVQVAAETNWSQMRC